MPSKVATSLGWARPLLGLSPPRYGLPSCPFLSSLDPTACGLRHCVSGSCLRATALYGACLVPRCWPTGKHHGSANHRASTHLKTGPPHEQGLFSAVRVSQLTEPNMRKCFPVHCKRTIARPPCLCPLGTDCMRRRAAHVNCTSAARQERAGIKPDTSPKFDACHGYPSSLRTGSAATHQVLSAPRRRTGGRSVTT